MENPWHGEGRISRRARATENKAPMGFCWAEDKGQASMRLGKLTFVVEVYAPALHPTASPEEAALVHKSSIGHRVLGHVGLTWAKVPGSPHRYSFRHEW